MRFKRETKTEKRQRLETWHKWFAWLPVYTNNHCVWLEYVGRRFHYYNAIEEIKFAEYCIYSEFEMLITNNKSK